MLKWTRRIALLLLALVVLVLLIAWWMLRGSLAQLEGESDLAGLSAPVSMQRDALGVVGEQLGYIIEQLDGAGHA